MADHIEAFQTPTRRPPDDPLEEPKTVKKHMTEVLRDVPPPAIPAQMEEFQFRGKFTDLGLGILSTYFLTGANTATIARHFGVTKHTIKRRRQEWEAKGRVRLATAGHMQPIHNHDGIGQRQKHVEAIVSEKNDDGMPVYNSLSVIAARLNKLHGINVTRQTIANDLQTLGFSNVARRESVILEDQHVVKRLAWANGTTFPDWDKIIFSDESWFRCTGGQKHQWVRDEDPVPLENEKRTTDMKLLIFGIIGVGIRRIEFIEGTVNADIYIGMLERALLPLIEKQPDLVFMQDNAAPHTAKATKKWFEEHNVNVLPWPARSPDLNPIEHFWAIFKRRTNFKKLINVPELRKEINEQFKAIPEHIVTNLVRSFPKRIAAVKKAAGGTIVNEYKKIEKGQW